MDYKLCILAAGLGSRMAKFSKHFNKVLIPIQGKPTICHIIEKFPKSIETIIALGYKGESLRTFLETAYPDRPLNFVMVNPFQGPGSGPGYSLLQCKNYLQCPFINFAGDTLVREEIPLPDFNWMGISKVQDTSRFCSVKINGDKVLKIDDKIKTDNLHAYIGILGIKDYTFFWNALENNPRVIDREIQVSNGISALLEKDLRATEFTWFDTGTPNSYAHALENYPNGLSYNG